MFKEYSDIVSVADMQKMLNIGKNTAYRLVKDNVIPSIKVGRIHKIRKGAIVTYVKLRR